MGFWEQVRVATPPQRYCYALGMSETLPVLRFPSFRAIHLQQFNVWWRTTTTSTGERPRVDDIKR